MDFVIGLDVGTAGSRAAAVAADGQVLAVAAAAHPSQLTGPGRIEQDPADWWQSAASCLRSVARRAGPAPLAVGLSGQMDGPVLIGADGQVLGRCHIWADSRATAECVQITGLIGAERLIAAAGKPAVPAYTAAKLLWLKAHEPGRFAAARRVLLPKDYLGWRLAGVAATDPSDASNTLLFDVTRRRWSADLAAGLGIPAQILPDVAESAEVTGRVTEAAAAATGLAAGVPVVAGAGDSITAAVASSLEPGGPVLTVLGSAGNVSAVSGQPLIDPGGRVHTGCHATPGSWIATGVQQAAGLALQWLRGFLLPAGPARPGRRPAVSYDDLTALASQASLGSDGVTFVPHLNGRRTPHYDPEARGAFAGLSVGHTAGHLARAVMEGVVFAQRESADVLAELGRPAGSIVTAGGGARSALWRAIQAGVHGVPVRYYPAQPGPGSVTPPDASALGAAIIAGTAAGLFGSLAAGAALVQPAPPEVTEPDPAQTAAYQVAFDRYQQISQRLAALARTS
jgi:xylulokinase